MLCVDCMNLDPVSETLCLFWTKEIANEPPIGVRAAPGFPPSVTLRAVLSTVTSELEDCPGFHPIPDFG